MIHLFINVLAASASGGITYIRNVVGQFAARDDVSATVALSPASRRELEGSHKLISFRSTSSESGLAFFV